MQNTSKLLCLITASLVAGTTAASAQGMMEGRARAGTARPRLPTGSATRVLSGCRGAYGALNGTNHPAPSSTQGDDGPEGNNNGTLTGVYRSW